MIHSLLVSGVRFVLNLDLALRRLVYRAALSVVSRDRLMARYDLTTEIYQDGIIVTLADRYVNRWAEPEPEWEWIQHFEVGHPQLYEQVKKWLAEQLEQQEDANR